MLIALVSTPLCKQVQFFKEMMKLALSISRYTRDNAVLSIETNDETDLSLNHDKENNASLSEKND